MAYNSGNPNGQASMANSSPVVIASNQSALNVQQNDTTASGSLSAISTYVTTTVLTGISTASMQVTGTFVGTLTPQVSMDGTNYVALSTTGLINVNTGAYSATITAAGIWQSDIAGFNYFRLGFTTYTSGTAVITLKATNATGAVAIDNPLPAGTNSIGNVGTVSTVTTVSSISAVTPGTAATNLGKARGSAGGTTDTGIASLGLRGPATAVAQNSAGQYVSMLLDSEGKMIVAGTGDTAQNWQVQSGLAGTGQVALKAAAGAGLRNYVTDLSISNSGTSGTTLSIYDGTTTVIWTAAIGPNYPAPTVIRFATPLRGTANTALNIQMSAASSTVWTNAAGYVGI